MSEETEVFRYSSGFPKGHPQNFNKSKCYAFALSTRWAGSWPNEKYYTTNPLQYLGKHIRSEEWGSRDQHGGAETFDYNGKETRIVYDYEGLTCFKEVPCLDDIGMPEKEVVPEVAEEELDEFVMVERPIYPGGRKNNRKSRKNNRKNKKKSARKNNRNL